MSGSNLNYRYLTAPPEQSKYVGVTWSRERSAWQTSIIHDSKCTVIGYYANKVEAAIAYDNVAQLLMRRNPQGEKHALNFGQSGAVQTATNMYRAFMQNPIFPNIHQPKEILEHGFDEPLAQPLQILDDSDLEPLDPSALLFSSVHSSPTWGNVTLTPSTGTRQLTTEQLDEIDNGGHLEYRFTE